MPKERKKNPHAVALGRNGGKKRAANLTPQRRKEIAEKAARERWGEPQEQPE